MERTLLFIADSPYACGKISLIHCISCAFLPSCSFWSIPTLIFAARVLTAITVAILLLVVRNVHLHRCAGTTTRTQIHSQDCVRLFPWVWDTHPAVPRRHFTCLHLRLSVFILASVTQTTQDAVHSGEPLFLGSLSLFYTILILAK